MKGEVVKCKLCGNVFTKQNSKHVYCSDACRKEKTLQYTIARKEEKDRVDFFVFSRDLFRCSYCGKSPIEDGVKLVVEHIFPRGGGGTNSLYNVTTACEQCNKEKFGQLLPYSVYLRLIQRNKQLNKGMSKEKKKEIRRILDKYYIVQTEFRYGYK